MHCDPPFLYFFYREESCPAKIFDDLQNENDVTVCIIMDGVGISRQPNLLTIVSNSVVV